jgi:hypothetical protein
MPKTVVALFENEARADDAVRDMEACGIPKKEVRTLQEPATFEVTGVMSFPRLDFETDLTRELTRIGATDPEAQSYLEGLRRGGALCFATGSDEDVEAAGRIMNRHGATEIEQVDGEEPRLPVVAHRSMTPMHDGGVMAGRVRQAGGGACVFVW